MPENIIYEGPIRVYTQSKEGVPFIIKSGPNAGKPYSRVSFVAPEGQTIYLADFSNHSREVGDNGTAKVAYSVKLDGFGEPELYNGNLQYVMEALKPAGDTQRPLEAHASGSATPTPSSGSFGLERDESIRQQVCIKLAGGTEAALIEAKKTTDVDFARVQRNFNIFKAVLDGKDEFDLYISTAKDTLEATEVIEMPGPDAPPEPDGSPEDDEFKGTF